MIRRREVLNRISKKLYWQLNILNFQTLFIRILIKNSLNIYYKNCFLLETEVNVNDLGTLWTLKVTRKYSEQFFSNKQKTKQNKKVYIKFLKS